MLKGIIRFTAILACLSLFAVAQAQLPAPATTPAAESSPLLKKVESYLRVLFAWGPDYQVKLGPPVPAKVPDLLEVPVQVVNQGHTETGTVYVTKDGKYMFRGEIRDLDANPFEANLAKLTTPDSPSIGPANASVTVVDFSDFECPHCRELYTILKSVEPEFPQVRFVFKNFPLVEIHPWAMTAALAAQCMAQTSTQAFLKFQGDVFDNQDSITPDNVWQNLSTFAAGDGLSPDSLHECIIAPQAKARVDADIAEGKSLDVESTPTLFINGRPVIGGDQATLENIIRFELARQASSASGASLPPPSQPRK
ncbi:MAG TPA: thioredoxin domain-containing protein [Candidatus Acidoferrales bacterium]|nr:thioredoxin domain-containing protein [Candidatus Acidoferrales bacterium]